MRVSAAFLTVKVSISALPGEKVEMYSSSAAGPCSTSAAATAATRKLTRIPTSFRNLGMKMNRGAFGAIPGCS
jgi:hypothetical protein